MNYYIVYEAVKKKASTTPPNLFIGNVEMAAAMGLVLEELKLDLDFESVDTPQKLKDVFVGKIADLSTEHLSEEAVILIDLVKEYQVKQMVNENLDNLKDLAKHVL